MSLKFLMLLALILKIIQVSHLTILSIKPSKIYEVHLINGKHLDSYDPVAKEIISRKATDLDKIQENTYKIVEKGVRYYDGKGNSWQLNYGYANATDEIHSGAYLKTTVGEGIVRVPLTGGK